MMFLRQSTASQEILLGPFVDSVDGNTAETSLTIANTDIKLWVEGATTLADKTSGGATHISGGYYYAVLDATDTATVGKLEVNVKVAGALAVRREFHVLEEAIYDALIAASATGALPVSSGGIAAAAFAAGAIDAAAIANGAIDAATFAADVDAEILSYLVDDATRIDASALNTAAAAVGSDGSGLTEAGGTGNHLTAVPWNAAWDAEVQSEVQDAIEANNLDFVFSVSGTISNPGGATTTVFNTDLTAADDAYNDKVLIITSGALNQQSQPILDYDQTNGQITLAEPLTDAPSNGVTFVIKNDHVHPVSQIQAGLATASALQTVDDEIATIDSNVDLILEDTGTTLPSTLSTIAAYLDTEIAAILADTNELQGDWANGGRLDLLIDAIKAVTDALPNSGALTDLATAAELAKVPKSDGTATWNATALASINAEADTAITDYDPPTRTELTTDVNSILSKVLKYVQLLARKDAAIATDNATELTAINADGGSGAGAFANTTDSTESIRDRGDAAWTTGAGGSAPTVEEIRQEIDANSTQLAAILLDTGTTLDDRLTLVKNILEADKTIDVTQTPWQIVYKIQGTATELLRQDLTQPNGSDVTSSSHIAGNAVTP